MIYELLKKKGFINITTDQRTLTPPITPTHQATSSQRSPFREGSPFRLSSFQGTEEESKLFSTMANWRTGGDIKTELNKFRSKQASTCLESVIKANINLIFKLNKKIHIVL